MAQYIGLGSLLYSAADPLALGGDIFDSHYMSDGPSSMPRGIAVRCAVPGLEPLPLPLGAWRNPSKAIQLLVDKSSLATPVDMDVARVSDDELMESQRDHHFFLYADYCPFTTSDRIEAKPGANDPNPVGCTECEAAGADFLKFVACG